MYLINVKFLHFSKMAKIIVSELHSHDSENFLTDLNYEESGLIYGGNQYSYNQIFILAEKIFRFITISFAIATILKIVNSYIGNSHK